MNHDYPDVESAAETFRTSKSAEAFDVLINWGRTWAMSLCTGHGLTTADGEDIAHRLLLQLWDAPTSFRGESSFKTWFTRCVKHDCYKMLRKKKTIDTNSTELTAHVEQLTENLDPSEAASEVELKRLRTEFNRALLTQLTPAERLVVALDESEQKPWNILKITQVAFCLRRLKIKLKLKAIARRMLCRPPWKELGYEI